MSLAPLPIIQFADNTLLAWADDENVNVCLVRGLNTHHLILNRQNGQFITHAHQETTQLAWSETHAQLLLPLSGQRGAETARDLETLRNKGQGIIQYWSKGHLLAAGITILAMASWLWFFVQLNRKT